MTRRRPAPLAASATRSAVAGGIWCSIRTVLARAGSRSTDDGAGSVRGVEPRRSARPSYGCLVLAPTRGSAEKATRSAAAAPQTSSVRWLAAEDAERAVTVCERDQGGHGEREPDDQG